MSKCWLISNKIHLRSFFVKFSNKNLMTTIEEKMVE